jgi:hypothetical protein
MATFCCCLVTGRTLQTPLGRPVGRRNDSVNRELKRNWDGVDWIDLNENRENVAGNELSVSKKMGKLIWPVKVGNLTGSKNALLGAAIWRNASGTGIHYNVD